MTAPMDLMRSSANDDWETPRWLFGSLDAVFHFTLDVAASHDNAKCETYYTTLSDGLAQDWGDNVCWMNPPYGREIGKWIRKAWESSQAGATVVCLVPARTDTAWWHEYVERAAEKQFLRGRVRFERGGTPIGDRTKGGATSPFPSAIVVFRSSLRYAELMPVGSAPRSEP